MPAMPELSSHDILTIVLSLTTISLLLLAHAVNGGGARQFFSCSSIVAGALASLSLFGIDVGINSWQYADPPTQAAQSKSQGAGSPAGGGSNGGGAAAQSGKAGTGGASGRDGNGGS